MWLSLDASEASAERVEGEREASEVPTLCTHSAAARHFFEASFTLLVAVAVPNFTGEPFFPLRASLTYSLSHSLGIASSLTPPPSIVFNLHGVSGYASKRPSGRPVTSSIDPDSRMRC